MINVILLTVLSIANCYASEEELVENTLAGFYNGPFFEKEFSLSNISDTDSNKTCADNSVQEISSHEFPSTNMLAVIADASALVTESDVDVVERHQLFASLMMPVATTTNTNLNQIDRINDTSRINIDRISPSTARKSCYLFNTCKPYLVQ